MIVWVMETGESGAPSADDGLLQDDEKQEQHANGDLGPPGIDVVSGAR